MIILDVQDAYGNTYSTNEYGIHKIDDMTIQVEKAILNKYSSNTLYIRYKDHPNLCVMNIPASQQIVDIPIELLECVLLGMSVKAHTMGFLTTDPRTGQSYVQNPYIDRYEMAIKKAIANGYIQPTRLERKDWEQKGFV